jgi:putative ABC transport system permease protein
VVSRLPLLCPESAVLHDFIQDMRLAVRTSFARPTFTLIAVLTIALAIGANTVVFGVMRGVVLRALPYRAPDRLLTIWPDHFLSYREVTYLREHTTVFADIGAWVPGWNMTLTGVGEAAKLPGARVTANLFSVLGVPPRMGRALARDEEAPGADDVVLLSASLWRTRFGGDRTIASRRIVLDGRPHSVAGVMPEGFELYQPQTQVWRVLAADPDEWYHQGHGLFAIGRLRPSATLGEARADLRRLVAQMRETFGLPDEFGNDADVEQLQPWLLGPLRPMLLVALVAVGFVLLLAGANLASLLLARAAGREREIAVRTALGASRNRLVRQLLTESVVLALMGGVGGMALAYWGMGLAIRMLPAGTPFATGIGLDPVVLAASAVLITGTGIVFGLAPALASARLDLQRALRGTPGSGIGFTGRRTRAALVAGEVGIATVLLVGAALMVQTLWRLRHVDTGFRLDGVLTLQLQPTGAGFQDPERRVTYYRAVFDRLASLPGVGAIGSIQHLPLTGSAWSTDVEIAERPHAPGATPPRVGWRIVGGDYFRALEIPIVAGRTFDARDRMSAPAVALVNQTMARRFWPGESPLGRRIRAGNATRGEWATVVGVVGDVRHDALQTAPEPELYQPFAQNRMGGMSLVVRTDGDPMRLAHAAVAAVRVLDPDVPIGAVRSLRQVAAASLAPRRTVLVLLGIFALVGVMLGIAGTYGIVAHHVAARTREFGIRIALGARPRSVVRGSLSQGVRLAAVGILCGTLGALVVGRWLQTFVFDVTSRDPLTLGMVALLLLSITALASYLPARRAARVDPVAALRAE